jgi:hypothetical protein
VLVEFVLFSSSILRLHHRTVALMVFHRTAPPTRLSVICQAFPSGLFGGLGVHSIRSKNTRNASSQ